MKIAKILRKIKLSDNMIVVFKEGTELALDVEKVASAIETMPLEGIVLLVARDLDDIMALSEYELNALGWYRGPVIKERLKKLTGIEDEDGQDTAG